MSEEKSSPSVDIFRDTPVRFFGYANEIGEALHPIHPKLLRPSYIVAFTYVGTEFENFKELKLRSFVQVLSILKNIYRL